MIDLVALAVAVLGSIAPGAPPASRRAHASITLERPHLVLGIESELTLTIEVHDTDGAVAFAPERALASIGTITSVTPAGPNRFHARYQAPASRSPQVTIIVVDLVGAGLHLRATTRLPLYGATDMPFRTSANASVWVRVGEQVFGPVRADAQGNVRIPIVVPPGVHDGRARATDDLGNTRETSVDLQPTPFDRVMIVAAPQLEVGSFAEVSVFAVNARGEPMVRGTTTLRASEGMVHPLGEGEPGEERFLVEAPRRLGQGPLRLIATAVDLASEPVVVLEKRTELVIPLFAGPPQRLALSASTDELIIGEGIEATVALMARDRHDNPASCAGARVTVERQPVALRADAAGCGRIVIPAPTRPSLGGNLEIEAALGALRSKAYIRVTPAPAVRLNVAVSASQIVGDGRQSVEVRVEGFDRRGRPANVPNLRWQAAGGRLSPARSPVQGVYLSQFTPNPTRMPRIEVLAVKGDALLSATTLVRVASERPRLSLAARVGLFTNFGSMAGPMAAIEALQALPGRAAAWAAGIVVSYLHNNLTTTAGGGGGVGLPDNRVEIDQVPLLAVAQYRVPVPLGANISVGGGAGISLARMIIHWSDQSWATTQGNAHALAAELHTDAAFPLAPGELVMGAHYLWVDLGRTSQGDAIEGNSVGFVGDIGFRMAW
jgi:hypothetical protein